MRFAAIDAETAKPAMGSVCQIGVALFEGGQLRDEWQYLVDPEDYFGLIN